MWKVTIKGLFAHKARFLLTAIAVVLGVSFLSGTLVLTDTIKRTFDNLFASVNEGTDAYVRAREKVESQFTGVQRPRISGSLVTTIGDQVPGVARVGDTPVVEGQLGFSAQIVDRDGNPIGNPGRGAPTLGFIYDPFQRLSPWRLADQSGEPKSRAPRADDEVVVDQGSADSGKLKVGQTVRVLAQGTPEEFKLVGVAKFGTADSPGGASAVLFTRAKAQAIAAGGQDEFDGIAVAARSGVSQTELVRQIERTLASSGTPGPKLQVITGATLTKENQDQIQKSLQFFNVFLLIFALVALFVGAFIIFNTFSIVVAQRTRELALMRAIGASGRQVLWSVLGEALVVGLVASAVGLVAGVGLSIALKGLLAAFGVDIPAGGAVVATRTVVVSMLVGTGITLFSAVFPARRAARVAPIAALRAAAIDRSGFSRTRAVVGVVVTALGVASLLGGLFGGQIQLVGLGAIVIFLGIAFLGPVIARPVARVLGWPLARARGITGELARENAARNPKRTSATAAALMIGVALVALITILASSTKASISASIDRAFRADYIVTEKGGGFGGVGFGPSLVEQVRALPEIQAATGLRFGAFEIDGATKFLAAAEPAALNTLFDVKPTDPAQFNALGPDQIAVSSKVAADKGWKVGDTVKVQFPNGNNTPMTIGAIYGFGAREGLTDYFLSTEAYSQRYVQQVDFQVYAKLKAGVPPAEGRRAIEQVVKPFANAQVQDQAQYKAEQEARINQFVNLIYALLMLAVIIALIGIANTLTLSIVERVQEIGLLRSVGMSRGQLRATIRWEAVIIALLGTVLGLVIGFFFGWAVVQALEDQGITEFAPPGGQLVFIVVLAGLLAVLFAYFPARRASRLDVLKAISTE
jgi:putative ABC transport system permease protein